MATTLPGAPEAVEAGPVGTARQARAEGTGGAVGRGARWLRWHPAWAVVVGCVAAIAHFSLAQTLHGDVFWQLAAGQWMLAHHEVIRRDVFAYTIRGRHWVADEWGFEVGLAWLVAHLGRATYWLVPTLGCGGALVLGVLRWRRQGASPLWCAALATLATGLLALGIADRPQVASYLLLAAELAILTFARRHRRWLFALPPLLALWANLHGSFPLGLVVLGLELGASLFGQRRRALGQVVIRDPLRRNDAAGALLASTAATFVNPHGVELLGYVTRVTLSSRLGSLIEEWQSPNFHSLVLLALIVGPLALAALGMTLRQEHLEATDLVLFAGIFVATLHAVRFAPYLGLTFGGLAAPSEVLRSGRLRPSLLGPLLSLGLAAIVLVGTYPRPGSVTTKGSLALPVRSASWVARQHGRVFSTYLWNDYLIALHVPVFVDGRTDLYFGTGVLSAYVSVDQVRRDPNTVLDRYGVRWVLWPRRSALAEWLLVDPTWRLVHQGHLADVFEHTSPARSSDRR